jgi:hypothetical protein
MKTRRKGRRHSRKTVPAMPQSAAQQGTASVQWQRLGLWTCGLCISLACADDPALLHVSRPHQTLSALHAHVLLCGTLLFDDALVIKHIVLYNGIAVTTMACIALDVAYAAACLHPAAESIGLWAAGQHQQQHQAHPWPTHRSLYTCGVACPDALPHTCSQQMIGAQVPIMACEAKTVQWVAHLAT